MSESPQSQNPRTHEEMMDGLGESTQGLEKNLGVVGKSLISALDRAVSMQSSTIEAYVGRLRRKNPDASPAEIQKLIDQHFIRLASGSGASAGAAAAIPGIGLATGTAAIAGESVIFLDSAAFYTVASAHLRGVDIRDPQRRRVLVLLTLLGSKGVAVIEAMVGDITKPGSGGSFSPGTILGKFSAPTLSNANSRLTKMALKQVSKRMMRSWIGKIMPLGIGAVLGGFANRRLAADLIENSTASLGPAPEQFATPLPASPEKDSSGKKNRLAKLVDRFRKDSKDSKDSLTGDAKEDEELDRLALSAMTDGSEGPEGSESDAK